MSSNRTVRRWFVDVVSLVLAGLGLWLPHGGGVPDEFSDRAALPACGRATLFVGQDEPRGEAVDCFTAALAAGGAAELVLEVAGVDSGPVFMYHRALPSGGVEIFMDHRRDGYRSVDWQHVACSEARIFPHLEGCDLRDL